jgi:serine/threonine-protein kinase
MAPVTASPEPEVIDGRYVLDAVIGNGAMAEVRRGDDLRLGRPVAVKLLHENVASQTEPRLRFEEEARAAARLTDPNVVAIYDTGEQNGRPYIVMELLPGRTLRDEIAEGPLTEDRAREVIVHVLRALSAAHAAGVTHRDIKPANILLTETGDAKVADFGIAKVAESSDLTATGLLLGTPSYLAPECVAGNAATPASDLYAVGVVLYEALSGRKPFTGPTPVAVCHAIVSEDPTPLRELCPDVSGGLIAVVERAMARDPKARYRNADSMIHAIEGEPVPLLTAVDEPTQLVDAEPTVATPLPPTEDLEPTSVLAAMPPRAGPSGQPPFDRGRARRAAAIAAGVVVLGAAAYAIGHDGVGTSANTPSTKPVVTRPTVTAAPSTAPSTLPATTTTKPEKGKGKGHKPGEG